MDIHKNAGLRRAQRNAGEGSKLETRAKVLGSVFDCQDGFERAW